MKYIILTGILLSCSTAACGVELQYESNELNTRSSTSCEVSGVILGAERKTSCRVDISRGGATQDQITVPVTRYQDPEVMYYGRFNKILQGPCHGKPKLKLRSCG